MFSLGLLTFIDVFLSIGLIWISCVVWYFLFYNQTLFNTLGSKAFNPLLAKLTKFYFRIVAPIYLLIFLCSQGRKGFDHPQTLWSLFAVTVWLFNRYFVLPETFRATKELMLGRKLSKQLERSDNPSDGDDEDEEDAESEAELQEEMNFWFRIVKSVQLLSLFGVFIHVSLI